MAAAEAAVVVVVVVVAMYAGLKRTPSTGWARTRRAVPGAAAYSGDPGHIAMDKAALYMKCDDTRLDPRESNCSGRSMDWTSSGSRRTPSRAGAAHERSRGASCDLCGGSRR